MGAEGFSDPEARVRELLLRHRLVTPAQLEDAEALRQARGRSGSRPRLVDVLVRQGVLPGADVVRSLSAPAPPPSSVSSEETTPSSLWGPLPPDVEAAAADPARRFGKYVLVKEAGRGATAVVWRAWDRSLSQTVALKLLAPRGVGSSDTGFPLGDVEDFIREARTAARLRHPNIVRVYEVGCLRSRYYLSMDFVGGTTLAGLIHAGRAGRKTRFATKPETYLSILETVARAIHHAHQQSPPVVHRDLKPANILLDASGQAFVADFGLARAVRVERRADGGRGPVKGTPPYMAPEQAEGRMEDVDARTDVYGLGAILYEILCGFPPFVGSSVPDLLREVAAGALEPPSRKVERLLALRKDAFVPTPKIPPALEAVCLKALAKRREDRYPSALAFADALREARRTASPAAPPPRRKRPALAVAAVALLIAAGAAWRLSVPASGRADARAERRAEWNAALDALRGDSLRAPLADLEARYASAGDLQDEFAGTWRWASAALQADIVRDARALSAGGPGPSWLDADTKARATRLLGRAEALLSVRSLPFAPEPELRRARESLAALVAWQGAWTLRVNVSPFAEVVVRRNGRELARGWTPLALKSLPAGPGDVDVELCWPSERAPRKRVVRTLPGLRHGAAAVISGSLDDLRVEGP